MMRRGPLYKSIVVDFFVSGLEKVRRGWNYWSDGVVVCEETKGGPHVGGSMTAARVDLDTENLLCVIADTGLIIRSFVTREIWPCVKLHIQGCYCLLLLSRHFIIASRYPDSQRTVYHYRAPW